MARENKGKKIIYYCSYRRKLNSDPCFQIPKLSFTSCMLLNKLFDPSVLSFPQVQNGNNDSNSFTGFCENEVRFSAQSV